jgi:hypothetical protein
VEGAGQLRLLEEESHDSTVVVGGAGHPAAPELLERLRADSARPAAPAMLKPTKEQQTVAILFPATAQWVQDGHLEVGDQKSFGFVARALDDGGWVVEDDRPRTPFPPLAPHANGSCARVATNW